MQSRAHVHHLATAVFLCAVVWSALGQPQRQDLFKAGEGGFPVYRIPGIVVTKKGTLLAYCEARKGNGDWTDERLVLRRSEDGGKQWSPQREVFTIPEPQPMNPLRFELRDELGHAQTNARTHHNLVMIPDRDGALHAMFCLDYWRTFYSRSDDDGVSWSQPREISEVVAEYRRNDWNWRVVGNGCGHGLQLASGRLLVPIWLSTSTQPRGHGHRPSHVGVLFSDNGGIDWQVGDWVAKHSPPQLVTPNETCAVQLADGSVMFNIRHENTNHLRAVVRSPNGATDMSQARFDGDLPEPVCEASIIRLTTKPERNRILFCNPDSRTQRRNLTLKLSYDEGMTWPVRKVLEPGSAGYSDLAVGAGGTIHCFFERGAAESGNRFKVASLTLATFDLKWLEGE